MHYHVWWRDPLPPAAGCSCRQAPKTSHFLWHLCSNSFASCCFLPASLTSVLDDFTRQDALWCMFHSTSSKSILAEKDSPPKLIINSTDGLPGQKRRRMYSVHLPGLQNWVWTCECITTMTFLGVNCATALILFLLLLVTRLLRLVTCAAAACGNLKRLQLVLLRRAHCPLVIIKLDLEHVLVILKCFICWLVNFLVGFEDFKLWFKFVLLSPVSFSLFHISDLLFLRPTECDISSQDFSVSRLFSFFWDYQYWSRQIWSREKSQYQSQKIFVSKKSQYRSQKKSQNRSQKIWSQKKSRYRSRIKFLVSSLSAGQTCCIWETL